MLGLDLADNELTAGLDPKLRKESLEALLGQLLERLTADGRRIALVIEDAQRLDPLAWDLLVSLATTIARRPVLILIGHRSEPGVELPAALRELPDSPSWR